MTTIPINLHPHEARAFAEHRLSLIIRPMEPQPGPNVADFLSPQGPRKKWVEIYKTKHLGRWFSCPLGAPGSTWHIPYRKEITPDLRSAEEAFWGSEEEVHARMYGELLIRVVSVRVDRLGAVCKDPSLAIANGFQLRGDSMDAPFKAVHDFMWTWIEHYDKPKLQPEADPWCWLVGVGEDGNE